LNPCVSFLLLLFCCFCDPSQVIPQSHRFYCNWHKSVVYSTNF